MATLHNDRYLNALPAQSVLFAEALVGADLQQRVPTCPDWTVHHLAQHVGQAHRWVTAVVTQLASTPVGFPSNVTAPEDADGLGGWLRDGAAELASVLRLAGPQTPVWSWADDHSVGFWARRMVHETAVHRADATLALGREFALDTDLTADAISEWLSLLCMPQFVDRRPELRGEGQILHLHATDSGLGEAGEWIVRRTSSGPVWEPGHTKGDVAVRGAVVDLLLVLTRRVPPEDAPITLLGDAGILAHWLEHTRL
jgi:uncharacterized protein (TIGR03083 family)